MDSAPNLLLRLRVNPDAALILARHVCHLTDEPVDVLSLTAGVGADIDPLHIRTVEQLFDDSKLLSGRADDFVFVCARNKRKGIQTPLFILLVVDLRITHGDQMAEAPGHDKMLGFLVSIAFGHGFSKRRGKLLRDAWLFSDKQIFSHRMTALLPPAPAAGAAPGRPSGPRLSALVLNTLPDLHLRAM